ncbi:MAG: MATE family efflux transporter [Flavobacteriaceae bacterium]
MSSIISLKNINKLAVPALISGVSEPILSLTDAAIVGNVSFNATESLAAVGIVTTFMSMLIWVLGQTRSAISSIVSQYLGANKLDQIKNLPAQAIFIITSLSILIILTTYPFASYIFKLYNAYIPGMHIKGAAYASVFSQILMALFAVYYLLKKTPIPLKLRLPFNKEIKRFILMILNLFIRTIALNVTLYYGSAFATSYGKEYIAAYTIAINLWFLGAFIVDGYASAGNILSGKLLGAKDFKTLLTLSNKLIKIGVITGLVLAAVGAVFYNVIGDIFSNDSDVLKEFGGVFWIVLAMQPFCALAFIFDGIYKGLGRMKYLRNVLLFSTFIVFIPILFWLDYLDLKLYAIFIAITCWIIARGIPLIVKFRKIFIPLSQKT